jgi:hypothetical protein
MLKTLSVDGLILDLAQIQGDIDAIAADLAFRIVHQSVWAAAFIMAIMPVDVAAGQLAKQYSLIEDISDRGLSPPAECPHSSARTA